MSSVQERLQLKRVPLDKWSIREQLCLASAVECSGDQNWMSVSRAMKMLATQGNVDQPQRPSDWFSQKFCAAQYGKLLENVDTPKRKKRTASDKQDGSWNTVEETIVRKLTKERIFELERLMEKEREQYKQMKADIARIETLDDEEELKRIWAEIEREKSQKEQDADKHAKWLQEREERKLEMERSWRPQPSMPHKTPAAIGTKASAVAVAASAQPKASTSAAAAVAVAVSSPVASTSKQAQAAAIPSAFVLDPQKSLVEMSSNTSPEEMDIDESIADQPTASAPLLTSLLKNSGTSTAVAATTASVVASTASISAGSSTSARVAPTITNLLTGGQIKPSSSSAVDSKHTVPVSLPVAASAAHPTLIIGPSMVVAASQAQTVQSPSQAAPTLSLLLENKSKELAKQQQTSTAKPAPAAPTTAATIARASEVFEAPVAKAADIVDAVVSAVSSADVDAPESPISDDLLAKNAEDEKLLLEEFNSMIPDNIEELADILSHTTSLNPDDLLDDDVDEKSILEGVEFMMAGAEAEVRAAERAVDVVDDESEEIDLSAEDPAEEAEVKQPDVAEMPALTADATEVEAPAEPEVQSGLSGVIDLDDDVEMVAAELGDANTPIDGSFVDDAQPAEIMTTAELVEQLSASLSSPADTSTELDEAPEDMADMELIAGDREEDGLADVQAPAKPDPIVAKPIANDESDVVVLLDDEDDEESEALQKETSADQVAENDDKAKIPNDEETLRLLYDYDENSGEAETGETAAQLNDDDLSNSSNDAPLSELKDRMTPKQPQRTASGEEAKHTEPIDSPKTAQSDGLAALKSDQLERPNVKVTKSPKIEVPDKQEIAIAVKSEPIVEATAEKRKTPPKDAEEESDSADDQSLEAMKRELQEQSSSKDPVKTKPDLPVKHESKSKNGNENDKSAGKAKDKEPDTKDSKPPEIIGPDAKTTEASDSDERTAIESNADADDDEDEFEDAKDDLSGEADGDATASVAGKPPKVLPKTRNAAVARTMDGTVQQAINIDDTDEELSEATTSAKASASQSAAVRRSAARTPQSQNRTQQSLRESSSMQRRRRIGSDRALSDTPQHPPSDTDSTASHRSTRRRLRGDRDRSESPFVDDASERRASTSGSSRSTRRYSSARPNDSMPDSPASGVSGSATPIGEQWKNAALEVVALLAQHRHAAMFQRNDASSYRRVVYRPMDLQFIRECLENNELRTTVDLQRDLMLMCHNAIMSATGKSGASDDTVSNAYEWERDALEAIATTIGPLDGGAVLAPPANVTRAQSPLVANSTLKQVRGRKSNRY